MSKGLKRICMNCGARFYDLDKTPIICPACGTEFTGEVKVKTRKTRATAVKEGLAAAKEKIEAAEEAEDEDIALPVDDDALLEDDDDTVSINAIGDDDDDEDDDALSIDSEIEGLDDIDDLEEDEDLDDDEDHK